MKTAHRVSWPDGLAIPRRGCRRPGSSSIGILAALLVCVGLAGCIRAANPSAKPSVPPSTTPSVLPSVTPSVLPSATATATPSPTPIPTATPRPTLPPTLTFVATGSMHTTRVDATATLLRNGKVLIAGGGSGRSGHNDVSSSAELYDPATGKFTPTGSMTSARYNAMATLLPNGKVLIAGGVGCDDPKHCTDVDIGAFLDSAELYDPVTGRFTRTGSMTSVRDNEYAAATLLPDGKVLIVGYSDWADVYDPSTGKFSRTMNTTVVNYDTATLLPNGKVLVTGETVDNDGIVAQLYDESSGKFTNVLLALPPGKQTIHYSQGQAIDRLWPETATLLPDGRVLLFEGGYLETYDPASGKCTDGGYIAPAGSAYESWIANTATLLADGDVLFTGEVSGSGTATALLYDPTDGLTRAGSILVGVDGQTTVLLPDGSVLIAGGGDSSNSLASAELFKP